MMVARVLLACLLQGALLPHGACVLIPQRPLWPAALCVRLVPPPRVPATCCFSAAGAASTSLALRGGEGSAPVPASSGGSPAGAGSVALQCTVESDAWDTHSRRKWTGEAASATELLAALSARFNVSAPATTREGSLLLQYYDTDVDAFVDLLDETWPEFALAHAKRVRVLTKSDARGSELARAAPAADADGASESAAESDDGSVFEGETTKEIGRGVSVKAFVVGPFAAALYLPVYRSLYFCAHLHLSICSLARFLARAHAHKHTLEYVCVLVGQLGSCGGRCARYCAAGNWRGRGFRSGGNDQGAPRCSCITMCLIMCLCMCLGMCLGMCMYANTLAHLHTYAYTCTGNGRGRRWCGRRGKGPD